MSHLALDFLEGLELKLRLRLDDWLGVTQLDAVLVVFLVEAGDVDGLVGRQHFVLETPAGAARKLGDDDITVAEELHVEVDVVDRLWLLALDSAWLPMWTSNLHHAR